MLRSEELYTIARCRFREARILLDNNEHDGAVYLCGYALELILKRRIVRILEWEGYPERRREAEKLGLRSFMVHDLEVLLRLAGLEKKIQSHTTAYAKWQMANTWDSEFRYKRIGDITKEEAENIIGATKDIINFILRIERTENI